MRLFALTSVLLVGWRRGILNCTEQYELPLLTLACFNHQNHLVINRESNCSFLPSILHSKDDTWTQSLLIVISLFLTTNLRILILQKSISWVAAAFVGLFVWSMFHYDMNTNFLQRPISIVKCAFINDCLTWEERNPFSAGLQVSVQYTEYKCLITIYLMLQRSMPEENVRFP